MGLSPIANNGLSGKRCDCNRAGIATIVLVMVSSEKSALNIENFDRGVVELTPSQGLSVARQLGLYKVDQGLWQHHGDPQAPEVELFTRLD